MYLPNDSSPFPLKNKNKRIQIIKSHSFCNKKLRIHDTSLYYDSNVIYLLLAVISLIALLFCEYSETCLQRPPNGILLCLLGSSRWPRAT